MACDEGLERYGASDIRWMKLNENFIVKMLAIRSDAMRFIHSTRNDDWSLYTAASECRSRQHQRVIRTYLQ